MIREISVFCRLMIRDFSSDREDREYREYRQRKKEREPSIPFRNFGARKMKIENHKIRVGLKVMKQVIFERLYDASMIFFPALFISGVIMVCVRFWYCILW